METNTNFKDAEVLMVEDDENDSELMLHTLNKYNLGNQVYVVRDGEEALEFIFATGRYAERANNLQNLRVILLDLKLPKIGGLEVLEKVKKDERTKKIPVVIVTSSKENADLEESYELGANSFIIKPIKFDDFAEAISRVGLYWLITNKSTKQ